MNKKELSAKVAEKANVTQAVAGECVNATFDTIKETVATGEKVDRTTLTLSITVEDKAELKRLAIANGVTVAGLIHQWIASAKND